MSDLDDIKDHRSERSRDSNRDRDRSRRGDRPTRFSEGNSVRDRSIDRGANDRSSGGRKSSNCRVYVSNISYEYRWQDLKDLFRENVGEVAFVELFVDEHDKPKGCGIVEFADSESVKKCMEVMHRFEIKGRKLVIKEDFGNERDKTGNIINKKNRDRDRRMDKDWDDMRDNRRGGGGGGGGQGGGGGGNWDNSPPSLFSTIINRNAGPSESAEYKWGNTYGLSPQFLESLNIHRPLGNKVFIANLDYKVDIKKLREVFKLCGKVIDVELYHDKEGNSRGFAVVEYDHPVESVQAISMLHNQMLFDRTMTVRMDRVDLEAPIKMPEGLKGLGMGLGLNGEPLRDVSRNLPSTNMSGGGNGNSGAGILGAVPTPAGLQALTGSLGNTAAALSNVVNTPALANLANSSAALQASLAGVQAPFLGNHHLGNELSLAGLSSSNLNSMSQSHALAAMSHGGSNMGGGMSSGTNMGNQMSRGDMGREMSRGDMGGNNMSSSMGGNMGNNMGGNMGSSMGGNMGNMSGGMGGNTMGGSTMGNTMSSSMAGNMGNNSLGNSGLSGSSLSLNRMVSSSDREYSRNDTGNSGYGLNLASATSMGATTANQSVGGNNNNSSSNREYVSQQSNARDYDSSQMRNYEDAENFRQSSSLYSTVNNGSQSRGNSSSKGNGFSDTIIVSNLPISATWKMLREKFSSTGDVQFVEMKSKDTAIIRYATEWQAERAIKMMDRVRIDGRTIDVRFFY